MNSSFVMFQEGVVHVIAAVGMLCAHPLFGAREWVDVESSYGNIGPESVCSLVSNCSWLVIEGPGVLSGYFAGEDQPFDKMYVGAAQGEGGTISLPIRVMLSRNEDGREIVREAWLAVTNAVLTNASALTCELPVFGSLRASGLLRGSEGGSEMPFAVSRMGERTHVRFDSRRIVGARQGWSLEDAVLRCGHSLPDGHGLIAWPKKDGPMSLVLSRAVPTRDATAVCSYALYALPSEKIEEVRSFKISFRIWQSCRKEMLLAHDAECKGDVRCHFDEGGTLIYDVSPKDLACRVALVRVVHQSIVKDGGKLWGYYERDVFHGIVCPDGASWRDAGISDVGHVAFNAFEVEYKNHKYRFETLPNALEGKWEFCK